jgi:hypothetical protein
MGKRYRTAPFMARKKYERRPNSTREEKDKKREREQYGFPKFVPYPILFCSTFLT